MSKKCIERIGEKQMMKNGQYAFIVLYENNKDITVLFEDGVYVFHKEYDSFKSGSIKNNYYPTIYEVGYLGNAKSGTNSKLKKSYNVWLSMLSRCYNPKNVNYKNYGEKGVTVSECFKCYENFERWFDNSYYEIKGESIQLDKDILIKGNKIYSPTTCMFVPQKINMLFQKDNLNNSTGTYFDKFTSKYQSYISIDNKHVYLGSYNTLEEAHKSYLEARNKRILELAEHYKDKIPENIYNRLIEISNEI